MHTATIRAADLELVMAYSKVRRVTQGRTAAFCAMSESPRILVSCGVYTRESTRAHMAREAQAMGQQPGSRVGPIERGYIVKRMQWTQLMHGAKEVRRTWGTGIRALLKDNRYILNGGTKS